MRKVSNVTKLACLLHVHMCNFCCCCLHTELWMPFYLLCVYHSFLHKEIPQLDTLKVGKMVKNQGNSEYSHWSQELIFIEEKLQLINSELRFNENWIT